MGKGTDDEIQLMFCTFLIFFQKLICQDQSQGLIKKQPSRLCNLVLLLVVYAHLPLYKVC